MATTRTATADTGTGGGTGRGTGEAAASGGSRDRYGGRGRDRGQTAIEFVGVTPLIILLLVLLWQCALFGYTFTLASNAADMGARAGGGAQGNRGAACESAANEDLPDAWKSGSIGCGEGGSGLYRATVRLSVPVLVPGVLDWGPTVTGEAASVKEG
ncbi:MULTISPECIES: TadE/TadG family type IV pilus assembly protein [unclassified Streptomyces]|uniref:TadE/TadG family type IV pilus assembly protein n=1 Tax=unclassified Streptomyces TaxID=2593676 RepID=UPI002E0FEBA4|nr:MULTISPECIES: TadE/TadG family type IV pilus assembly protein [unclassified Streptomyces]WSJ24907.1 pilus assembly protein [Streptomyces sp. NBC_01324]